MAHKGGMVNNVIIFNYDEIWTQKRYLFRRLLLKHRRFPIFVTFAHGKQFFRMSRLLAMGREHVAIFAFLVCM